MNGKDMTCSLSTNEYFFGVFVRIYLFIKSLNEEREVRETGAGCGEGLQPSLVYKAENKTHEGASLLCVASIGNGRHDVARMYVWR